MKTESEARQLWCPFARTSYSTIEEIELRGVNRGQGPSEVSCVASNCMAWRKQSGTYDREESRFLVGNDTWIPGPRYEERYTGNGFCGLAGEM